ncbi:LapA family protein [Mycobacterium sp. 94-17]|uniref:LapA family protein n=1 Tax=Mycobacterium sp. 94-17 TaxID=2986147 RepID=UPI002D1E9B8F|nr:LapA family protein [Mycobacterium sp. 94-17]MEB4212271.1 LapA family protein [Mycobacterium sp. 94-17]
MRHSPVDNDRTADRHPQEWALAVSPGFLVIAAAALAFVVCVADFALGHGGAGVAAAIVSMLAFGAGLSWLAMDRRRIRDAEREWVPGRPVR